MNYEWTKLYFETQFEAFAKGLGKECGLREKEEHEAMIAHVEREVGSLRGTIEAQRKFIEALEHRTKGLEAMFAPSSSKDASDRTTRRPS